MLSARRLSKSFTKCDIQSVRIVFQIELFTFFHMQYEYYDV